MLRSALPRATLRAIPLLALTAVGGMLGCDDPMTVEPRAVIWGNAIELFSEITPNPNELVAAAITVPERSTITHVGVIYAAGGYDAKVAIYADAGGAPGPLVAATGVVAVVVGRQEIPLTPTTLAPGTYWVATVHNNDAHIAAGTGTTTPARWAVHTFASAFPATFPASTTVNGPDVNYYLQGTAP